MDLIFLIEQMKQPGFYPHPVQEPIELIQTHISYVFLTGDYVYKIKKPVNLGFLDFSTLERRQHFCWEELHMNKPNAPEIYLEVLPISQIGNNFILGGNGQILEYTLKMRQFPQETLLIEMFEQGKLQESHLEELGTVVAHFHAQAQTNDYIRRFGRPAKIRESIDNNYRQTQKYISGPQTSQQYEETKEYTDTFFAQNQELLTQRLQNNRIKECHGDLHLRNICFWHDKIQLFDRIEFNEQFRFVDVIYDIAFTVMDLEVRGAKELANAFLNTYLEQTGDWEGLQVLPLYLSRQAYVRAKVNSFLLDDPNIPEAAEQKIQATASDYYRLAWEYTKSRQGRLILTSGLSGSGKTTVARYLARHLGAIHLRSDVVRKHLAGISLEQRGGDEIYTPAMTQKTYQRLLKLGLKLANLGYPVILDAKYDKLALRGEVISQANSYQLPLQIIYCIAPESVLRDRLLSRTNDVSDATADLIEQQQAAAENFTDAEKPLVINLDTTQEWKSQLLRFIVHC
ncbi:MAG: AAA family ATPase [Symploca sp. SIO1C4]|uniref:gluconokinase n=1 Tax=Symploca sp. SIO1C4 TaxID=2607765 RepID=A0A6B3N436_9CYAN|nr:AAA family ATPase [Symploca sp. SIO1C4]